MRNISFALTTEQIRNRTKTVTRRTGWRNLKPGTLLSAVVKSQGLKKGEKVERICTIRVVDVSVESLDRLWKEPAYGLAEIRREGFGDHPHLSVPENFVAWFAASHKCEVSASVTRIEFEYVEGAA
ncbi:MAG TPA: hypothetical protein VFA29_12590 [Candidatus Baltobacteraceae bacterium]|nr:hypothetical protein [Candidatus Baltobacteraceae bacterium]